ncbi:MAG: outer membrane lipoprotein chaperone LolA [Thermodesulfobacteriota bacterium]
MKKIFYFISGISGLLIMLFLLSPRADAVQSNGSDVVAGVERRYESILTLDADFTQVARGLSAMEGTSGGHVYFKKPAKIRWVYKGPIEDEIIGDGKVLWFYQPDLNQAFKSLGSGPDIATDFLSGMGSIRKHFKARATPEKEGLFLIELKPLEYHQQIKTLTLQVVKKTLLVEKFTIVDHYGNTTEVTFTNISVDVPIEDELFKFSPPAGTAVLEQQRQNR